MSKPDMSVARVKQYGSANIGKAERHNERKNKTYENLNVVPERISMNVHFKDPGNESYLEIMKRMEAEGKVSTRGLRKDATLFDEMIIDVNTMYFEEHGGYDFAKNFFEDAFHFAEEKYGAENIISAVMHADELNQAATEEKGYPVYHYHLHVIAMPVVEKKILWSKRCKDEKLRGTVKEVVNQISHSKKWESKTPEMNEKNEPILRANGKPKFRKSYSILQDEVHDFLKDSGYRDFERGEKGSTAEHLESLQYQYQKDLERKEKLEHKIEIERIEYKPAHEAFMMYSELKSLGKKTLSGKIVLEESDFKNIKRLAREGLSSRTKIADLKDEISECRRRNSSLEKECSFFRERCNKLEAKLKDLNELCRPYLDALKIFPDKVKSFLKNIMKDHERQEPVRERIIKRHHDMEL